MFHGMEYVYEVYKEHNFSKAARNLFISQPALSSSIKRIEERIGEPIFDRSTTPIQLTECGEEYIRAVEQIMDIQQSFVNYLADTRNMSVGKLSIGSNGLFSSCILPPVISEYKKKFPQISITLIEEGRDQLENLLMNGQLDFVIDNQPFSEDSFESRAYVKEHLLLAVPESFEINHSLFAWKLSTENIRSRDYLEDRYPAVPLELFKEQPFILLKPGSQTYEKSIELCRNHGFTPEIVLTLGQQLTAYNMACAGMGVTFISDTLAQNSLPSPNITYYKLDSELSKREIYFSRKRNRYTTRVMEEFLKVAELYSNIIE